MMKVKDFIKVLDMTTKVCFLKNGKPYRIKNDSAQNFYKVEQVFKDEKLLNYNITLVKGAGRDAIVVKLKKEE
jgi:hypothetical protein